MTGLHLRTERLELIAGTAQLATAAVEDPLLFAQLLHATVPATWPPEILADAQMWLAQKLTQEPQDAGWWIWYVLLNGVLIGTVGFKGLPSSEAAVEVGYSLLPEYEGHGYATEATRALIDWAFQLANVKHVDAQTFPHHKKSLRVMEKCGMILVGLGEEPGTIRCRLSRS